MPPQQMPPQFAQQAGMQFNKPQGPAMAPMHPQQGYEVNSCGTQSTGTSTPPMPSAMKSGGVEYSEHYIPNFNPQAPNVEQTIATLLGKPGARLQKLSGKQGKCNFGIWEMENTNGRNDIVKVVGHGAIEGVTEAQNTLKNAARFPGLLNDKDLCYPYKICHVNGNQATFDVFVMRKAMGKRLAEALHGAVQQNPEIAYQIVENFGVFLRTYEKRYNKLEHGDLQPPNIFYDEATQGFSLCDVGWLGIQNQYSDAEHFCMSLSLGRGLGEQFAQHAIVRFRKGYNSVA